MTDLITEARGVKSVTEQAAVARQTSEMQLLPEKQEYAGFVGGDTQ